MALVNHSSKDIFNVIIAFPDPENVDFDMLCAIMLTFLISFIMHYCVAGSNL